MKQIIIENLTKEFSLKRKMKKVALDNISLSVNPGEAVAVIGKNGSGKSTLLKIIAAVTAPTKGKIKINGSVSALLELGAGFQPEYTGIENIYLNGMVNGLTKKDIRGLMPEILEFAQIGDYINRPVKTYSDGMFLRLAFSVAICTKPDILIVDEALAVGDFLFRAKCYNKIEELLSGGTTLIYVTHDADSARRLCTRGIWLDNGKIMADGSIAEVTSLYMRAAVSRSDTGFSNQAPNRYGSHIGAIEKIDCPGIWQLHHNIKVKATLSVPPEARRDSTAFSLGIKNQSGLDIMVLYSDKLPSSFTCGEICFSFENLLCKGKYLLTAALENKDALPISYYDYAEGIAEIESTDENNNLGMVHILPEVKIYEETLLSTPDIP